MIEGQAHAGMVDRGATRPEMDHSAMDRGAMLAEHQQKTLWVWWTVMLLGLWVAVAPFSFGHGNATVEPSGGREVWLFWSPSPAAYLNDTIVGMLVISLTILIPGMPNMVAFMKMGGDVTNGWSCNPSSWPQRWIMIALAFAGFVVSRYLAAYQLGHIDHVWDPFFGESSHRVLDSKMVLVISQPVAVGAWCTFCLLAAANNDERSPSLMKLPEKPRSVADASTWGMSVPWTLAVSAVLALGLLATSLPRGPKKERYGLWDHFVV